MRIRRPRLQQGERVREDITSSKGQASRSKKQEQAAEERKNKLQEQATAKREEESKVQEQEASQQAEAMGNRKKERKMRKKTRSIRAGQGERKQASLKHRQPQAEGLVRLLVAWCFGVAEAIF